MIIAKPHIGIMVGSSMDGVDCAAVLFNEGKQLEWELLAAQGFALDDHWRGSLERAGQLGLEEFFRLDAEFGAYLGDLIRQFIEGHSLDPQAASVHGFTVSHHPEKGYSIQLGKGSIMAAHARVPVITDLRSADIAAGGQGAPLAPIADRDLFRGYSYFLNLGGIANISASRGDELIAVDLAGCNQVLNRLSILKGLPFDKDGDLASKGKMQPLLMAALDQDAPPLRDRAFSLDNRWVKDHTTSLITNWDANAEDRLNTYCAFLAKRIADWINLIQHGMPVSGGKMLCTGGGCHNRYLLEKIMEEMARIGIECHLPEKKIIDFKEAILFAYLGHLRWNGNSNSLPSVTGASVPTSGGAIYLNT